MTLHITAKFFITTRFFITTKVFITLFITAKFFTLAVSNKCEFIFITTKIQFHVQLDDKHPHYNEGWLWLSSLKVNCCYIKYLFQS